MKIVLIGSGNVATQLGLALYRKNFNIVQIYSRTKVSASLLADRLHTSYVTDIKKITTEADLLIFSVKDSAIESILKKMPLGQGLYVHTAGSVPMDIFTGYVQRYGVFYPLQTFSKNKALSFEQIPILLESYNPNDEQLLYSVAEKLSKKVNFISSVSRKHIHLSAVFACNFTNHMYTLAADILEKQGIDWSLLLPLIEETLEKVKIIPPKDAQTGPAIRYDKKVMQSHLQLLDEKIQRDIYKKISLSIHQHATSNSKHD